MGKLIFQKSKPTSVVRPELSEDLCFWRSGVPGTTVPGGPETTRPRGWGQGASGSKGGATKRVGPGAWRFVSVAQKYEIQRKGNFISFCVFFFEKMKKKQSQHHL